MNTNSREILAMIFDLVLNFSKNLVFNAEAENLSSLGLYVLLYLAFKGPKKMSEIATDFAMTKANITVLVDSLEQRGFVERQKSNDDRRIVKVKLTKNGIELCEQIIQQLSKLIDKVASSLPPKDMQVISDGFTRLLEFFNNPSNQEKNIASGAT